jgi:hypothetical protein
MSMKRLLLILMLGAQATVIACSALQAQAVVQRQSLEKQQREYRTPTDYQPRVRDYDPKTGDAITYDHKPRVDVLDAKARKFAFKWIGYDGQEKTATFQSADAVNVLVSTTVSATPSGEYLYTYEVRNLPSSGAYLKRFIIQNFASDVKPERDGDLFPGLMSKEIRGFSEGNWISFADVSDDVQVDPGQVVKIHLTSSAPPGLVECRASAQTVIEGADEDIPSELEALLPGFDEYPHGNVIGPVERLKHLSTEERIQYMLDKLPQFRKSGWITDETLKRYEQLLKSNNLEEVIRQAEPDLKAEQITTEVFSIIRTMK